MCALNKTKRNYFFPNLLLLLLQYCGGLIKINVEILMNFPLIHDYSMFCVHHVHLTVSWTGTPKNILIVAFTRSVLFVPSVVMITQLC